MNAQRRIVLVVISLIIAACIVWLYRTLRSESNAPARTSCEMRARGSELAGEPSRLLERLGEGARAF